MTRLVIALGFALLAAGMPASGWTQEPRSEMGGAVRRPAHRPRPPFVHRPVPVVPCCLGLSYHLPEPPPVIVPAPPPVVYITPAPPSLVYVAPPRVEPAPEIQLPNGRWERHGNGKEYPYTWVWVGAAPPR